MMAGAIEGQAAEEPVAQRRRDNLFAPVAGLHRTRGRFSGEAADRVPSFDARAVRWAAVGLGLGLAFLLGAGVTLALG
jgi:hypothetical protein